MLTYRMGMFFFFYCCLFFGGGGGGEGGILKFQTFFGDVVVRVPSLSQIMIFADGMFLLVFSYTLSYQGK